jgi:hypothetical protein
MTALVVLLLWFLLAAALGPLVGAMIQLQDDEG